MRTEVKSAIMVFSAIGVAIAGVSIYFNSIMLESSSVEFQPVVIEEDGAGAVPKIDKSVFQRAPELGGISGFINTEPVTLADLQGKVVVVDFWTYSCINCIRTTPYLNAWHEKYSGDGLVILGVHSPEFEFEKDYNNVQSAVEKFGIKYPVVQDNAMDTWKAFKNRYWPHKYIVDHEGYIRYDHIGEGSYDETEHVIQELLKERAVALGTGAVIDDTPVAPEGAVDVNFFGIKTPELYLGYFRGPELGNTEKPVRNQVTEFSIPAAAGLVPDKIYLQGLWKSNRDHMELVSDTGKVLLEYNARSVNIVAGGESTALTIRLDDELTDSTNQGIDVDDGSKVRITEERLYNLVSAEGYGRHVIEIEVEGKGFRLYTFTFG